MHKITKSEAAAALRERFDLTIAESLALVNAREVTSPAGLRDEFAKAAIVGVMADPERLGTAEARAALAYEIADAMLAEREK